MSRRIRIALLIAGLALGAFIVLTGMNKVLPFNPPTWTEAARDAALGVAWMAGMAMTIACWYHLVGAVMGGDDA